MLSTMAMLTSVNTMLRITRSTGPHIHDLKRCRDFALASEWQPNVNAPMAPALRRLVILFAALAFIVTSAGWGVAGALLGLGLGHENMIASMDMGDHHADPAAQHAPQCSNSDECGNKAGHQDLADSCCGSSCHIVTQAGACGQILVPIARHLEGVSPEDDIMETSPARLERPPRSLIG